MSLCDFDQTGWIHWDKKDVWNFPKGFTMCQTSIPGVVQELAHVSKNLRSEHSEEHCGIEDWNGTVLLFWLSWWLEGFYLILVYQSIGMVRRTSLTLPSACVVNATRNRNLHGTAEPGKTRADGIGPPLFELPPRHLWSGTRRTDGQWSIRS